MINATNIIRDTNIIIAERLVILYYDKMGIFISIFGANRLSKEQRRANSFRTKRLIGYKAFDEYVIVSIEDYGDLFYSTRNGSDAILKAYFEDQTEVNLITYERDIKDAGLHIAGKSELWCHLKYGNSTTSHRHPLTFQKPNQLFVLYHLQDSFE